MTLDDRGDIVSANSPATRLFQADAADLVGRPLTAFVPEQGAQIVREHLVSARMVRAPLRVVVSLSTRGGRLPVRLATSFDAARGTFCVAVVDLTERQRMETALRDSEARLKLAQSTAGAGVWDWNLVTDEHTWSVEYSQLLGLEPDAGQPSLERWLETVHPEDRERMRASGLVTRAPRSSLDFEYRVVHADGAVRWLASRGRVLTGDDDEPIRLIGITIDVTELKQAEQRLIELNAALEQRTAEAEQRATQLRGLAADLFDVEERERRQLASELHDDLGQILVVMKLKLASLRQSVSDDRSRQLVDDLGGILDRANRSIRSLTFQAAPPILHELGLAPALIRLAESMRQQYGLKVEVEDLGEPEHLDSKIRYMLFRSIQELLLNVVKHAGVDAASVVLGPGDDGELAVVVEDRGRGMDPEAPPEAGRGFGLFSIEERLSSIGGRLEIESEPGEGTRASLVVPVAALSRESRPLDAPPVVAVPEPSTNGRRKIQVLLADDHKVVRTALATLLASQPDIEIVGEASDGAMAVELARQRHVDVVVMDVTMPRLNGIEATRRIARDNPRVRVVGLSMHESGDVAAAMREAGAAAYVTKGGPTRVLIDTIREVHAARTH